MSINELTSREDRPPLVRFERRPVEDVIASQEQGRYVAKDVDFVLVTPPYSKDCIVHKVSSWLLNIKKSVNEGRTPKAWLENWEKGYSAWKNGQEMPLRGTPIKGWGVISPAQQEMLIQINCPTVEDLADINDEGLRRIGIGAMDLKNKAKAWLASLSDHGATTLKIASLESENTTLRESLKSMQEQISSLKSMVENKSDAVVHESQPETITASDLLDDEPAQKRRGRPPAQKLDDMTI